MSAWHAKAEFYLRSMLTAGEGVIRTGNGSMGVKFAFIGLTNKRLLLLCMGTWRWSEPKYVEIGLEHIVAVHCEPSWLTTPPLLVINSRTGHFSVSLTGRARKEAGHWPNWILTAQDVAMRQAHPKPGTAE
jgi:hypothetical protein